MIDPNGGRLLHVSRGAAHGLALRVGTHQHALFQLVGVNRFCLGRMDTVKKVDIFRQFRTQISMYVIERYFVVKVQSV